MDTDKRLCNIIPKVMNIKVNLGNLNTQKFFSFTKLSDLLNISRDNI